MKRTAVSMIVAGILGISQTALAAEPRHAPATDNPVSAPESQAPLAPMTLAELFASVATHVGVVRDANGMTTYENPIAEVVVARRNPDGTVSRACVETEEAARNFLQPNRDNAVSSSPAPEQK